MPLYVYVCMWSQVTDAHGRRWRPEEQCTHSAEFNAAEGQDRNTRDDVPIAHIQPGLLPHCQGCCPVARAGAPSPGLLPRRQGGCTVARAPSDVFNGY